MLHKLHDFLVRLRTGSNPADIDWFRIHTANNIYPIIRKKCPFTENISLEKSYMYFSDVKQECNY